MGGRLFGGFISELGSTSDPKIPPVPNDNKAQPAQKASSSSFFPSHAALIIAVVPFLP